MDDKSYDYAQLFNDYGVEYEVKSGKSRNFLSIPCPYCRQTNKLYGGINTVRNYFNCWKCGYYDLSKVIMLLTGRHWHLIRDKYLINASARDLYLQEVQKKDVVIPTSFSFPLGTAELSAPQKEYLCNRGFVPEELIRLYGLKGTGRTGHHSFRIVIPIFFEGQMVSWTCRDYTGLAELRYLSCGGEQELMNHKDLVYGIDMVRGSHVMVCEGPTDKWRLGVDAVALFGTGYKQSQVNLLAGFEKATIIFDGEGDARKRAEELAGELAGRGREAEIVLLDGGDPGEMSQKEADDMVEDIMNN